MSELWDYYATRSEVEAVIAAARQARLRAVVGAASEFGATDRGWVCVYTEGKGICSIGEVVLYFFDHNAAAWSFEVWRNGESLGRAVFGENPETGAKDEGFEGDLAAIARALGVTEGRLERTFGTSDSTKFLRLLGLSLPPMGILEVMRDAPPGVSRLSDLGVAG